jgi:hypothetical protein
MPERTFIHKTKAVPGFKVRVSTLYDVCIMIKKPTTCFSECIPIINLLAPEFYI